MTKFQRQQGSCFEMTKAQTFCTMGARQFAP